VAGVLDPAVELAVREGAGAALAKLNIRRGVEDPVAPEVPGVAGALANRPAPLEDERAEAHLRQAQGGEKATGAGADDDGAPGRRGAVLGEAIPRVGGRANAWVANGGFVSQGDVDGVDQGDRGTAAGVVAAAGDRQGQQVAGRNSEAGQHRVAQGVGAVVERELQFGQAEH
jgi:hypothetical protein